jgi:hypothetical protein
MKADGTIILQLGSATFNGAVTEGHFEYPPNHPDYEKLLKRIQPIAPGKIVKVYSRGGDGDSFYMAGCDGNGKC